MLVQIHQHMTEPDSPRALKCEQSRDDMFPVWGFNQKSLQSILLLPQTFTLKIWCFLFPIYLWLQQSHNQKRKHICSRLMVYQRDLSTIERIAFVCICDFWHRSTSWNVFQDLAQSFCIKNPQGFSAGPRDVSWSFRTVDVNSAGKIVVFFRCLEVKMKYPWKSSVFWAD